MWSLEDVAHCPAVPIMVIYLTGKRTVAQGTVAQRTVAQFVGADSSPVEDEQKPKQGWTKKK